MPDLRVSVFEVALNSPDQPLPIVLTHISETMKRHASSLLTRSQTVALVDRLRKQQSSLVDELVPTILTMGEVQRVLQELLREKVSIRNLELILEVLVEGGRGTKDVGPLTELVRQRLSNSICEPLVAPNGYLHVLTFDSSVEQGLGRLARSAPPGHTLAIEPRAAEQLLAGTAQQAERMLNASLTPVLLCAPELRRHIKAMTERVIPHLRVISMTEIPNSMNLKSYGTVGAGLTIT